MMDDMPCSKYIEWHDHYVKEPWGYEAEVHRHAQVCQLLHNGLFHPKQPSKYDEWVYPHIEKEEKDWKDMKNILKARSGNVIKK